MPATSTGSTISDAVKQAIVQPKLCVRASSSTKRAVSQKYPTPNSSRPPTASAIGGKASWLDAIAKHAVPMQAVSATAGHSDASFSRIF